MKILSIRSIVAALLAFLACSAAPAASAQDSCNRKCLQDIADHYLAALVATMPGWVTLMIERDELNLDDPANEGLRTKPAATRAELVKQLDEGLVKARKSLAETTEAHLMKPWRFIAGGKVQSNEPRHVMLTDSVFAHLAHHRGQLTVYLRLNEASVPAIYGPSADELY